MNALFAVVATPPEYVSISAPAKALALDLKVKAERVYLDIGQRAATTHGKADAIRQIAELKYLLTDLEFALSCGENQ